MTGLAAGLVSGLAEADDGSEAQLGTAALLLAGAAPAVFSIHQAASDHMLTIPAGITVGLAGYAVFGSSVTLATMAGTGELEGIDSDDAAWLAAVLTIPSVMGAAATCHGVASIIDQSGEGDFDAPLSAGMCAVIGANLPFTMLGGVLALVDKRFPARPLAIAQGLLAASGIAGSALGATLSSEESLGPWLGLAGWSAATALHASISLTVADEEGRLPSGAARSDHPPLSIVPTLGAHSWGVTLGGNL
jgi:hypothetical protein